jgi:hypothetical protein
LIEEIDTERYGKPLIAALHLCNDLADELERLKEVSSATVPLSAITYAITLLEIEDKDGKALQYLRAVEDRHSSTNSKS